ncbi:MAG: hydantoinase/oxoprolinase family protein [Dehalococcoidia bacterium]|nr:hydantoinase/oxoprolinase family protein [Dehalococcoidia bacterium]
MPHNFRLGFDIGGTFTDLVILDDDEGTMRINKLLTTPKDPSIAVVNGLRRLLSEGPSAGRIKAGDITNIVHATTLATNAIIEKKGARTALITTEGFRDVLQFPRRYDPYDFFLELPVPLVPRRLTFGVKERLRTGGEVLIPLDPEEVRAVAAKLKAAGVESVAVCFLHSFDNPAHEEMVARILSEELPGLPVSLSSRVVAEIGEQSRASTTAANAYIRPIMDHYMGKLEEEFKALGIKRSPYMMLSNGGMMAFKTVSELPVRLVESGPAAGTMAAAFYGRLTGHRNLVALDMGGTTAKVSLIEDGRPQTSTDMEVARVARFKPGSGLPLKTLCVELLEIGAGGGSIAHINELGLLKVGPESSGADPGPACYGFGGTQPTVTDCDLLLGYLDAGYFLGGEMTLDKDAAAVALSDKIGGPLGFDATTAAAGVFEIVNENMAAAAREHMLERGADQRDYAVFAFGGAGPVHGCYVAQKAGVNRVIVPLGAGALAAFGLLVTPVSMDFVQSYGTTLDSVDWERLNAIYEKMENEGRAALVESGVQAGDVRFERTADIRYKGQGYEVITTIPDGTLSAANSEEIKASFHLAYEKLYASKGDITIEILNWRLLASGPIPKVDLKAESSSGSIQEAVKGKRKVYFPEKKDYVECTVYDHYRLGAGATFDGPAIVEEKESTAVVPPGAKVTVDRYRNLLIDLP